MTTMIFQHSDTATQPVAATGRPSELLGDMTEAAQALIVLIERERSGRFDDTGHHFWTGRDALMEMARRIVGLGEQLRAEQKDAGSR